MAEAVNPGSLTLSHISHDALIEILIGLKSDFHFSANSGVES